MDELRVKKGVFSRIGLYWIILAFQMIFLILQFLFVSLGSRYLLENKFKEKTFSDLSHSAYLIRELIPEDQFKENKLTMPTIIRMKKISEQEKIRITMINNRGEIFFDSHFDYREMDNHSQRPEIMSVYYGEPGESYRFSDTLQKKMYYYAIPFISNGTRQGIVRIALPREKISDQQSGIFRFFILINIIILLIISFIVAILSNKVIGIIREIEIMALKIGKNEPIYDIPRPISHELTSLTNTILDMSEEIKSQQKKLTRLTLEDSLTGLGNRRKFDETLDLHWQLCLRNKSPLSFLIIDIDYFKRFNDALGHPAGDRCLQDVANLLKKTILRKTDIIVRLGGEEFGILMPDTDAEGAFHISEMVRKAFNQAGIPHPNSKISPYLTSSMGLDTITPSEEFTKEDLFDRADKALYLAKHNGRNRIEIYGEEKDDFEET